MDKETDHVGARKTNGLFYHCSYPKGMITVLSRTCTSSKAIFPNLVADFLPTIEKTLAIYEDRHKLKILQIVPLIRDRASGGCVLYKIKFWTGSG
jgi:hypothetical protein